MYGHVWKSGFLITRHALCLSRLDAGVCMYVYTRALHVKSGAGWVARKAFPLYPFLPFNLLQGQKLEGKKW